MSNVFRCGAVDRILGDVLGVVAHSLEMPGDEKQVEIIGNPIGLIRHLRGQGVGDVVVHLIDFTVADEKEVDALEKMVDSDGVDILLRLQPVASDLRQVV
jgi:phosphate uptake regulator